MLENQMRIAWTTNGPMGIRRRCPAVTAEATPRKPTIKPCANMLRHFRLLSHALRVAPRSPPCPAINARRRAVAVLLYATASALVPALAAAATPAPHATGSPRPKAPLRIDVTKIQPKSLLPKRAEHQEYVVEINKYGQVARVRTERGNGDPTFNAQTYGNVLQAFIRTPDGQVVLGTYRLTYDFDPKTARVRRDVTLLRQGGVNPDAQGAVPDLMSKVHSHTPIPIAPNGAVDPRHLPDLDGVIGPSANPSPR